MFLKKNKTIFNKTGSLTPCLNIKNYKITSEYFASKI